MAETMDTSCRRRAPRILIADDHPVVIEGLCGMLQPQFEIVGAVSSGSDLVRASRDLKPDLIIADISMPLLDGIEAARQIRQQDPEAKIIFFSMHKEVVYARQALAVGGHAYVLKNSTSHELITAINHVLQGRVYITELIAEALKKIPCKIRKSSVDGLTPHQRDVLQLLAQGKNAKEIAAQSNISVKTVEFHKSRIKNVLGVRTTAELARYAAKNGLVK